MPWHLCGRRNWKRCNIYNSIYGPLDTIQRAIFWFKVGSGIFRAGGAGSFLHCRKGIFRPAGRHPLPTAAKDAKRHWGFARTASGIRLQPLGRAPQTPLFTGCLSSVHRFTTGACNFELTSASATRSPLRSALHRATIGSPPLPTAPARQNGCLV